MAYRLRPVSAVALVAAIVGSSTYALTRPAQADAIGYVPPKIAKQGSPTSGTSGAGVVTLKVYVLASGKPQNVSVNSSTNHGDDAAAKEMALATLYKPALRGGKPVAAFYTYKARFTGSSATADTSGDAPSGSGAGAIEALNRQGKFADAEKSGEAYVTAHPADSQAIVATAVAASFAGDNAAAATYFDKAGTIPDKYKGPATSSYMADANSKLAAKDYAGAEADAKKVAVLAPGAGPYNLLGNAELSAGDAPSAVADFEKAKSYIATDSKATPKAVATIDGNLAVAYLKVGDVDKAQAAYAAAKAADPSRNMDDAFVQYYQDKGVAANKAGNTSEAVADFEQAAKLSPKYAVSMYTSAATIMANGAKPDFKAVKTEADKALALDPSNARANYIAGVALINGGSPKDALPYLQKADTAAKAGTDTTLQSQIAAALKAAGGKS
jgi:tetratricopeptide (TPR) repeat protein